MLGFILALMRMSPVWPVKWLARMYISIFRGTPLIAQLFMIYYGLPQFGIELDPIPAAMIGLSLNTAAYAAETLRAAIASIDKGQWEAAASIGMTPWQTMRRAILPQAARVALPPLSNSFISLVKDTSLAATIQVPELFRQAQLITSRTLEVFTMYLAASLIYWVMATVLSSLQNYFENQLNRRSVIRNECDRSEKHGKKIPWSDGAPWYRHGGTERGSGGDHRPQRLGQNHPAA